MTEEQKQEQNQEDNNEIDLDALQDSIDESQSTDADQENNEQNKESQEQTDDFNLDNALDSFEPINLEGKVSDEEAKEKALERGWREDGEDKYGHNISAIEFLERTPLFHKMDLMRGDVDELKKQNKKILEQSKAIAKKAIDDQQKLLEGFKAEKEKLLDEEVLDKDDINKIKTLDKKIEDHSVIEEPADNDSNEIIAKYDDAMVDFKKSNEWYQSDYQMTTKADKIGTEYAQQQLKETGSMPEPSETLNHVLNEIKKDYPDMGKQKRNTRVSTRSNRTVTTNRAKKKSIQDLPEDMQAVARNVMEAAGLSEDDYMNTYEV